MARKIIVLKVAATAAGRGTTINDFITQALLDELAGKTVTL